MDSHPDIVSYRQALYDTEIPEMAKKYGISLGDSVGQAKMDRYFSAQWRLQRRKILQELKEEFSAEELKKFLKEHN